MDSRALLGKIALSPIPTAVLLMLISFLLPWIVSYPPMLNNIVLLPAFNALLRWLNLVITGASSTVLTEAESLSIFLGLFQLSAIFAILGGFGTAYRAFFGKRTGEELKKTDKLAWASVGCAFWGMGFLLPFLGYGPPEVGFYVYLVAFVLMFLGIISLPSPSLPKPQESLDKNEGDLGRV